MCVCASMEVVVQRLSAMAQQTLLNAHDGERECVRERERARERER